MSKEDQEAFDRLFDRAKMHTSAGIYMSNPWPMETILLSICLEHGKMIEEILGLIKEKEKKWVKGIKESVSGIPRVPDFTYKLLMEEISGHRGL